MTQNVCGCSAKDLMCMMASQKDLIILDVREPDEYIKYGSVSDHDIKIPLGNLKSNLDKLDKNKKIVVYCHGGVRSEKACQILEKHGFNAVNLCGGIMAYNCERNNSC
jgi:rhodanese-related sulfurtransferase